MINVGITQSLYVYDEPRAKNKVEVFTMSDNEKNRLLRLRAKMNKKRPEFLRTEYHRLKRIQTTWRRPRGIDNKMRHQLKGKRKQPGTGYRNPKAVRGLHPSGFEVVQVFNVHDLDKVDNDLQIAEIGRTVGSRKRVAIIEKAEEMDIHIINPRLRSVEEFDSEIEEDFDEDYELLDDDEDEVDLAEALDDEDDVEDADE